MLFEIGFIFLLDATAAMMMLIPDLLTLIPILVLDLLVVERRVLSGGVRRGNERARTCVYGNNV